SSAALSPLRPLHNTAAPPSPLEPAAPSPLPSDDRAGRAPYPPSLLPARSSLTIHPRMARQLVAGGHGGGGGVLANHGIGTAAAAGKAVSQASRAGGSASSSYAQLLSLGFHYPPSLQACGLQAIAGGELHAAPLRDPRLSRS
ncbi:unnamed protein product, partial [Urochloa humidicola]